MEKVTIVVPVYNTEKYLDECIKSIVNQTYENIEVILIDDGSKDNSPKICDKWAQKDSRIQVIHKMNEGAGIARNTGISNASGEYICFFDSDDYIEPYTIEKSLNALLENNADIVLFGFCDITANGKTKRVHIPNPQKYIYEGKEVVNELVPDLIADKRSNKNSRNLILSPWSSLTSMKPIKKSNWHYVSERDIISEDVYSLMELYNSINKVVILPQAFYYYRENENSLTHTYLDGRFQKIKNFYLSSISLCNKLRYNDESVKRLDYVFINLTIAALKSIIKSNKDKALFSMIITDPILIKIANNIDISEESNSKKIFLLLIKKKKYNLVYYMFIIKNNLL